jgi:hypothetical protein
MCSPQVRASPDFCGLGGMKIDSLGMIESRARI